ncbi:Os11g0663500 [Oryza sativa Japonica Group]|uniref:Os11g0663500 protein n=1 Tax=Oryza sativa subsp. japonica TaxID=39947 RepID=Q2R006_ORYSJ|nr:hypothetical protein LOC_Os11g44200 [Oryza sativa Japonica Group]BAT15153.1 Os11g0663500 [Oryza sativa Japonica Group]
MADGNRGGGLDAGGARSMKRSTSAVEDLPEALPPHHLPQPLAQQWRFEDAPDMRDEESKDETSAAEVFGEMPQRQRCGCLVSIRKSRTTQTQSRLLFAHMLDLHQQNLSPWAMPVAWPQDREEKDGKGDEGSRGSPPAKRPRSSCGFE